jgi:hypothetical protein
LFFSFFFRGRGFVPAVPGRSIFEKARKKTAAPLHLSINLAITQKNCEKHRGAAAQIVEIETTTPTREAHMGTCSACDTSAAHDPCDRCVQDIADGWDEFDRQRLSLKTTEDLTQRNQRS